MRRIRVSMPIPLKRWTVLREGEIPDPMCTRVEVLEMVELYHIGYQLRLSLWADILRQREGSNG